MEKYNIINLKIFDFGNAISDKIWNWKAKNKEIALKQKILKDEIEIKVTPRFQRKYLFESPKQQKKIFKRKNFSFQPQRYQIRRNQF